MQPITDISLLKYHRVNYRHRIDTNGTRGRSVPRGVITVFLISIVALSVVAGYSA